MTSYTHNGRTYELITKGKTHGTFREVLPDGSKGKKFVSSIILKHGQKVEPDNKQKKLF